MAKILISVGSNVERALNIRAGVRALTNAFGSLTLSSVYESEAVGFDGEPFFNMAIAAETDMPIVDIVSLLKQVEDDNGRIRKCERFSSRTLDLDLLTYDQQVTNTPIELPRDEITKNAFVLWPLAEIAAEDIHPVTGLSYAELWQAYDKQKQKLWVVEFDWQDLNRYT